jgi:hypothetical protein
MSKTIKNTVLTAMAAAVLCAGSVSARQLYRPYQTSCRGFCTQATGCPNILGCACVITQPGATVGMCSLIAAKPAK